MDDTTARALVGDRDRIKKRMVTYAVGEITSLSPLSVKVSGASTAFTGVKTLIPVASGDIVAVLRWANDLVVLGKLISAVDPWHVVGASLQNSWVDNAVGREAQYRKLAGVVFIEGVVKSGSAANAVIFTLPAGYRPDKQIDFIVPSSDASGTSQLRINTDGTVFAVLRGNTTATHITCSFAAA